MNRIWGALGRSSLKSVRLIRSKHQGVLSTWKPSTASRLASECIGATGSEESDVGQTSFRQVGLCKIEFYGSVLFPKVPFCVPRRPSTVLGTVRVGRTNVLATVACFLVFVYLFIASFETFV